MGIYEGNKIHYDIVKRVFPLSIVFLGVYTPYSFFILNDIVAGWSELAALVLLLLSAHFYFKPENTLFICNFMIAAGFPVLIPWLFSGGPAAHALWWSPIFALWVSFYASGKHYFLWMGAYVAIMIALSVLSVFGYFRIAYTYSELLNILFATVICSLLIHYYEQIRRFYEELSKAEALKIIAMQEQYINLLESAPDAILVYDTNQHIVLSNLQAENVFGYTKQELTGLTLNKLIPYKDKTDVKLGSLLNNTAISGQSRPVYTAQKKDGTLFSAEINTSINTKEQTVTVTVRDITEREMMTNTLLKQNKQLESFTQMASHDLRGPVGNLQSLLDLYSMEESAEERAFLMDTFKKVVGNLTGTLDELLELINLNHEQSSKRSLLAFEAVFSKITDSFGPEIKELNAEVIANFEKAPAVEYSNAYLESIMQNLLSNALKYRSPERVPRIQFESNIVNGQTILQVKDNGRGIDMNANGAQVFGFLQTFHSNPDAKGLGLFLTKKHIESMGGEITVDSEVGVGTSFQIVFNKPSKFNQISTLMA